MRHHHCRGAQQLLRRQSSTLDGGTLKVARCSSAARSTVWCARRTSEVRSTLFGTLDLLHRAPLLAVVTRRRRDHGVVE